MTITHAERAMLAQLRDRDHQLTTTNAHGGYNLPAVPGNRWARHQVDDWRVQGIAGPA